MSANYTNNQFQNGQKVYANANIGKLYRKAGQYGEYFSGDFCGAKINGKIDQQGNISIQFPTEHAEAMKSLVQTYLEQSGLAAKYAADRAAYEASKGAPVAAPQAQGYAPQAQAPAPQQAYAPRPTQPYRR